MLLLSGQVELNPGPYKPKYPCQICSKAVKWGDRALACDNCDQWYHVTCMTMSSEEYHHLANTSTTWICKICNAPNYSKLYDSISTDENSFSSLSSHDSENSDLGMDSSNSSLGSPIATSSPKRPTYQSPKRTIKSLRVVVLNFQSIKNKVNETQVLIDSSDPDIIIGTETWLNKDISSAEVLPTNFQVFRNDRQDSHGGVLIAVRDDITCSPVLISQKVELVSVKLHLNRVKSIIISSFYRPPNATQDTYSQAAADELSKLRTDHPKSDFWVGGDFNLPDIDWSSLTVTSTQYPHSMSEMYLDIVRHCSVEQMINFPTRGSKTLDIFLTSSPGLIDRCKPLPGVGDHDAILIDTLIKPRRVKPSPRTIYLWDKANMEELKAGVTCYVTEFNSTTFTSTNSMWTSFRDNILGPLDKHVPHKLTRSRFTNPWMDTTTRRLARRKNRAFKKAKTTGRARDHRRYLKLKTTCQKSIRQAHNNYMRDIISPDATQNPKKFWSFIKGKKQESSGVAPLRHEDGTLHSNSQTKAEILNTQFKSVFTKEVLSTMPDKGDSPYSPMEPINVTVEGVLKLLQNIKPHKATGPDSIPARLLKELSHQLAPALTRIYRDTLEAGEVPDDWKMAHIVPIFKKGDKSKASNYRPVSLTAICSKLMEHILHSNIITHLERHSILTEAQHGFRSRRSCETQLIYTVHELARGLSEGKQIDAILLDFSKAFDKVPHERLLYKLHYYGGP